MDVSGSRRSGVLQRAWLVQRSRSGLDSFLLNKACKGLFVQYRDCKTEVCLRGRIAII